MSKLRSIHAFGLSLALAWLTGSQGQAALAERPGYTTVTVRFNGPGRVLPDLNGHQLRIGSGISLCALASPGYIFAGWTGTFHSLSPRASFDVVSGLELQADFIPNPFPALQGEYSGLAYRTDADSVQPIAFFSFRLNSAGRLNGKLMRVGQNYIYDLDQFYWEWPSERLEQNAQVQGWVFRHGLWYAEGDSYVLDVFRQDLTSELRFDFPGGNNHVRGTLSDAHQEAVRPGDWQPVPATWEAGLLADRAAFDARLNPAPQAGTYTLIFPGGDGASQPAGAGFASLKIDAGGKVNLTGFLSDGRALAQRASLSQDGHWPLFVRLYGAHGALIGWMNFTNGAAMDLGGSLVWTKPAGALPFAGGFTTAVASVGSRYVQPANKGPVLNLVHGMAVFSGGDFGMPWTNTFSLGATGKVTSTSGSRFSLSLVPRTGLFNGTFRHPVSGRTVPFKGAVLQSQNCGYGYFLDPNKESGRVFIGPQP